jgi:hypothetical protein
MNAAAQHFSAAPRSAHPGAPPQHAPLSEAPFHALCFRLRTLAWSHCDKENQSRRPALQTQAFRFHALHALHAVRTVRTVHLLRSAGP